MEAAQNTWHPLGELIVGRGLITQEQLEDALLEQRITRKRLGTILIDKGIVSAQQLTDVLVDQIGVEDLLDEFDRTEADSEDAGSPGARGGSLRRFLSRLQEVRLPSARRLATPFSRLRARTADLTRRNTGDGGPVAPFTPSFAVQADGSVPELVQLEPAAAEPHAWLMRLRQALEQAESELARLDDAAVARAHELEEARSELAALQAEVARESKAHRQAEEEIGRLHALIDERDAGLTELETSIEELGTARAALEAELADARSRLDSATGELEAARTESAERHARIEELETTLKDHERRGARIAELEAQTAELAENLAATDETLGIEMHAREQAQREANRLQDELDERDSRVAKLANQVELLEAELQAAVAEREQATRKLGSRERRVVKLESTLAELRADSAASVVEPEEATQTEPEPEQQAPEAEATVDAQSPAETEPEPEAAEQAAGFLYFVPRPGEGYELVEQDGEAPEVGDRVEVEDRTFDVTRHSRSPLPFDRRVCVYLRAAGSD